MLQLDSPISQVYGVAEKFGRLFQKLGIETIKDLFEHYPFRYVDFSQPTPIKQLKEYEFQVVSGRIKTIATSRSPQKRYNITKAVLADETGEVEIVWFNQPYLEKYFAIGSGWYFSGEVKREKGSLILNSPDWSRQAKILPIYHETYGLSSKRIRYILSQLVYFARQVEDYFAPDFLARHNLVDLKTAISQIHFPDNIASQEKACERLAFDELFFLTLNALNIRRENQKFSSQPLKFQAEKIKELVKSLPFQLTGAQKKAAWQILKDLEKSKPMNRLLEGDVGSGKTVVGVLACYQTVLNKAQVVWLAPTEILAVQHYQTLTRFFEKINLNVGLLTASQAKILEKVSKDSLKDWLKNGLLNIVVGTHALLAENIAFKNLGLIIVDEQHRFGVKQRGLLAGRRLTQVVPHFLSMTATPIPRTLALTVYGELDVSVIDELPKGRIKIITKIIHPEKRKTAEQLINSELKKGRQVFVITPLIERKEAKETLFDLDNKKAAKEEWERLKKVFPERQIGLLYGKMPAAEKNQVMSDFKEKKIDILVSTSVVEVGVDIPNATVMMIEGAENFGLAQLHQFRGRVGRSHHQSYCLLVAEKWSEKIAVRLKAMEKYQSGFELAEVDLKLRGPGELFGIRQSGVPDLKIASFSDRILVEKARQSAKKIIAEGLEKYPKIEKKLAEFNQHYHLE